MKNKLRTVPDDNAGHALAPFLWRCIGRLLATVAGGILLTIVLVYGESWAIRQAPLLLIDSATDVSPVAGCIPEDSPDAEALPLAILH
jgi:hypothetical protein